MKKVRDKYMVEIRRSQIKKKLKRFREEKIKELEEEQRKLKEETNELDKDILAFLISHKEPLEAAMHASNEPETFRIVKEIRQRVSKDSCHIPTKEFNHSGLLEIFLTLIREQNKDLVRIQIEVSWTFYNLAHSTGACIKELVHSGLIQAIEHLLVTPTHEEIFGNSVGILVNIIGESIELRNMALDAPFFFNFLQNCCVFYPHNEDVNENLASLLSNCLRGSGNKNGHPHLEKSKIIFENMLKTYTRFPENGQIKYELSWACCFFVSTEMDLDDRVVALLTSDARDFIIKGLESEDTAILHNILKTIYTISSCPGEICEMLLDEGEVYDVSLPT